MKKYGFMVFILVYSIYIYGLESIPSPSSPEYDAYKQRQVYVSYTEPVGRDIPMLFKANTRDGLLIPRDGTFTSFLAGNDDGSSTVIALPFTFNLYGQNYSSFYVNNNGNVSFGAAYNAFNAYGFPVSSYPMLAPFWADVDTRPTTSGKVWWRVTAHQVVVIWDQVGYYSSQVDKLNTFEVIFTDGTDPTIGLGYNVAFSYGDMQWTTGSASGGVGGFGGTAATVGVNKGDGVNYALIGRFDHAGGDWDGPGGNNDGVSYLDNQFFQFLTASGNNIPPLVNGVPDSPIYSSIGSVTNVNINAIGPETPQTVIAYVSSDLPSGFTYEALSGNPCTVALHITGTTTNVGSYHINLSIVDNGTPPLTVESTITVNIFNTAPQINSLPITQTLEDEFYQYTLEVDDPDIQFGDNIGTVEFIEAPSGMLYNASTNAIEWTPSNSNVGMNTVQFRLWDTLGGFALQSYTLEVINVNDPPAIDLPTYVSFVKGNPLVINMLPYISDVDSDQFTISVTGNQNIQATVNGLNATFNCMNWTGSETITVTVSDSLQRLSASDQMVVEVLPARSCYDIQYTANSNGNSPYNGQSVTVEGLVSGVGTAGFFVTDAAGGAYSGLYVQSGLAVQLQDRVLVMGTISEVNGFTAMSTVTNRYVLATAQTLPAPVEIYPNAVAVEAYEGVLCKITNVVVTTAPNTNQEFSVSNANGTCKIDNGYFYPVAHTWSNVSYGQLWQSITGIVDSRSGQYFINPRSTAEMILSPVKTCYQVQYSTLPDYVSPLSGQTVQVEAVVTGANLARGLYWIGDTMGGIWSGLAVHNWTYSVAVGDRIRVTGVVTEYMGQTELDQISSVQILSSGNTLPLPTQLQPGQITGLTAEQYEGVLVTIPQVSVSVAPDVNQEFMVDNNSGSIRIDNRLYPLTHTWQNMDVGRDWRSITGILDYINSSFRVIPRNDNDLVELNEFVVAVNYYANNFQIIDTRDNTSFGPYLTGQLGGNQCIAAALSPNSNVLLLSNFEGYMIYHINLSNPFSPIVVTSYATSFKPEDICFSQDGRFALVADGGTATQIAVIDLQSRTTVQTIDISPRCAQGISIGPDGKVLINDSTNSSVYQYRLDLNTGMLSNTEVSVAGFSTCVNTAIHPSGKYAVVNSGNANCKVFSLNADDTITVLQTLTEFVGSQSAIYSFDGSKVFFLCSSTSPDKIVEYNVLADGTLSYVYQYNLSANSTSLFYGVDPLTTNVDGSRVYVADSGSVTSYVVDVINTVTHSQTTVSALNPSSLEIGNLPLQAMFTLRQAALAVGQAAKFTQYSTGGPETFLWSFGDGTTSTQRHPQHIYTTEGIFTVSLTVTAGSRTSTITKTDCVAVIGTASIRYIALSDSIYTTGMAVSITQEIDSNISSHTIRIETNILNPAGINVAGASAVYTIHGTSDDAVSIQRTIPAGTTYGTYSIQTIVYDNISNIQQGIQLSEFEVIPASPAMSFDPPNLAFGTVMVTDSLMLEIDISNSGYNNLNITQFSMPNASFHLSVANVVVPRRESRTLQITFVPTTATSFNGALTITSNSSTGTTVNIPLTAQSQMYAVPTTAIISPEQINHTLQNVWQVMAEVTFADPMLVDASTLQYRYDRNGNGSYDANEQWNTIAGYSNASVLHVQQAISWRQDGEHLCFEFRAQNMRHSGWSYTGTANTMGIADDYYVRLDATPPQWIESFGVTGSGSTSVSLAWSSSADVHFASYEIYYSTSEGVSNTDFKWDKVQDPALAVLSTNATTITGLNPNATYYFVIRGRDSVSNVGDFSDEVSASTGIANNVQNLQLTHGTGTVTLSWAPLLSASQYKVYHAQSPTGPWTLLQSTASTTLPLASSQSREFFYVTGEFTPAKSELPSSKN